MTYRAAICADVHVGNHQVLGGTYKVGLNERCRLVVNTLRRAVDAANEEGCTEFVVAGDLFDGVRPSPQMMAEVMSVLRKVEGMIHLLLGNHDMVSTAVGDHALGPLNELARVSVWEKAGRYSMDGDHSLLLIPFQPGKASDWLPQAFTEAYKDGAVTSSTAAVLHLGLRDEETRNAGPWMVEAEDAVDVEQLADLCGGRAVQQIYAGNWHGAAEYEMYVSLVRVVMRQVGALCPTGWDNSGREGYGAVEFWPPIEGRPDRVEILGPRFVYKIPSKPDDPPHPVYVRLQVKPKEMAEARADGERALQEGRIDGYIVEPLGEDARALAHEKVNIATSDTQLDAAVKRQIAAFHAAGKLEGLVRERVFADVRRYLVKAKGG